MTKRLAWMLTAAAAALAGCQSVAAPAWNARSLHASRAAPPVIASSVRSASSPPTTAAASRTTSPPSAASSSSSVPALPGAALAVLATLAVKGRAPKTGYDRDAFGPAWTDDSDDPLGRGGGPPADGGVARGGGCDTRNDVLRRDLTDVTVKAGTRDCLVLSGVLRDPYTAHAIAFTRGEGTSEAVQIDHVVALSDAWQKGAQYWTPGKRVNLANDPLELLAVDGPTNEAKGDGDAATWLPPNKAFRCTYVARQIAVKAKYGLWITSAEHDAMTRVLSACPDQPLPTEAQASALPAPAHTASATTAAAAPPPAPVLPTSAAVYYKNCAAVRAAGKAPLYRGQPGYRAGLDRDGDGVACEK